MGPRALILVLGASGLDFGPRPLPSSAVFAGPHGRPPPGRCTGPVEPSGARRPGWHPVGTGHIANARAAGHSSQSRPGHQAPPLPLASGAPPGAPWSRVAPARHMSTGLPVPCAWSCRGVRPTHQHPKLCRRLTAHADGSCSFPVCAPHCGSLRRRRWPRGGRFAVARCAPRGRLQRPRLPGSAPRAGAALRGRCRLQPCSGSCSAGTGAAPCRGSPSHSSASGAVTAGVPPRDARTLATIPHELLSPLPGRLRPAPSCVPCAGQECRAAVPEHGLFASRRLSPQMSRVHGGLLCCLSSGQLRRGRPGRGPGRGTDAGRGGLRWQGCCVARGGWPGDLRWQFLGRGVGGVTSVLEGARGTDPGWPSCRGSGCGQGHCQSSRKTPCSRVSVRPQLPALWPLCPCAQLRPPCRRRGPSWGGRLLSATVAPTCPRFPLRVLSLPRQDLGFLCRAVRAAPPPAWPGPPA